MYSSKAWRESREMRVNKHSMTNSWYQVGGFVIVVFVPYTPGGVLAKTWRSTIERLMGGWAGGLKVVEQVGKSILSNLQRADPFKESTCDRDCFSCNTGGGDCEKESVGYEISCEECGKEGIERKYIGETSKNSYKRGKQHLEKYCSQSKKTREATFMWKHTEDKHDGRLDVKFGMKVLLNYLEDPLGRQLNEGMRVKNQYELDEFSVLNSGGEWHMAVIPRLNPSH